MKHLFTIIFILIICNSLNAQENSNKWFLEFSGGIEQHDKRLFDYPEKKMLLEMQPEKWGTYHVDLTIKRKVWGKNKLTGFIGIGLSHENATFLRPFDHGHFADGNSLTILRNLNTYKKLHMPFMLATYINIGNNWFLECDINLDILFFRSINHTENDTGAFPFNENTFELDEIHLSLGINYRIKQFTVGINSKAVNYQKIDKIIFNYIIKDPRTDQNWEWYNPLRFDFVVGYMF